MKCPNCGSENLEFVNQTVQYKKAGKGLPIFFIILSIIGIIASLVLLISPAAISASSGSAGSSGSSADTFAEIVTAFFGASLGAGLLRTSVIVLIVSVFALSLLPYKTKNVIVVVCKDCGRVEDHYTRLK